MEDEMQNKWAGWIPIVQAFVDNFSFQVGDLSLQCSNKRCIQLESIARIPPTTRAIGLDEFSVWHSVCYDCGDTFCEGCFYGCFGIHPCSKCEKMHCEKCVPSGHCESIGGCPNNPPFCFGCLPTVECKICESPQCIECAMITKCDACGGGVCKYCITLGRNKHSYEFVRT